MPSIIDYYCCCYSKAHGTPHICGSASRRVTIHALFKMLRSRTRHLQPASFMPHRHGSPHLYNQHHSMRQINQTCQANSNLLHIAIGVLEATCTHRLPTCMRTEWPWQRAARVPTWPEWDLKWLMDKEQASSGGKGQRWARADWRRDDSGGRDCVSRIWFV